jgi:preprotein translocase subunit YajC
MNTAHYVNTITSQAMRIVELEDQVSALRRELANVDEHEPEPVTVPPPVPEPVTVPPPVPEPVTVPPPVTEHVAMVRFEVGDEHATNGGMFGKVTHRIVKRTDKCVYIETTENGKTYKPKRKAVHEDTTHGYEYTKHGGIYIEFLATNFKNKPTPKPTTAPSAPTPSVTNEPTNPARYFKVDNVYKVKVGGDYEKVEVIKRVGSVVTCKWLSNGDTFTKKAKHNKLVGESFMYGGLVFDASNWQM